MKVLKINNKDYVLKFTSQTIRELNSKDITLNSLIKDMENLKINGLYDAFYYGLKTMQKDITQDKALSIIDEYFEEDENNDIEKFFTLIIEEYSNAMGLGKLMKESLTQAQEK
jgi:hypothetical protein